MKNKDNLFSKNDYDIQIEEIIENKEFDDEAKSLILNILYKIESSYKDYSKIKNDVQLKSEIISNIMEIIKKNCKSIKIMDINNKNKIIVNRDNKIISVFPNEIKLLQALYYIKTQDTSKIDRIADKSILTVLNIGNSINGAEIIRDFNGWSWNCGIDRIQDKNYNLIYQNLGILLGYNYLEEIINENDIKEKIYKRTSELYGVEDANEIVRKIEKCCCLLYINRSNKNKIELSEYLRKKQDELYKLSDKSKYISEITNENNECLKIITKIEGILSDNSRLYKMFQKEKIKEKYNTIENYKKNLEKIKEEELKKLNINTMMINPFEYVKRKKYLQEEIKTLNSLNILSNKEDSVYLSIIDLQKKVIKCFYKKIEIYDLKKELINLIYEIRYYNLLQVTNEKKIKDINELNVDIREMQQKLIYKLCANKIITIFSKDAEINYDILKYIFETKVTNINKIQIRLEKSQKKLNIEYYDENVLEKTLELNLDIDELNDITKKDDKKTKIFL